MKILNLSTAPYHTGPKTNQFKKSEIDKMVAQNIFEPYQNEWALPIAFAYKMDLALLFCVPYRKLGAKNTRGKRDSYLSPLYGLIYQFHEKGNRFLNTLSK